MAGVAHRIRADRLLHQAELETDPDLIVRLIRLAHAYADLAAAEELRTANILRLADWADDPDAHLPPLVRVALLAIVRRRLELFTPAEDEDSDPNGGT